MVNETLSRLAQNGGNPRFKPPVDTRRCRVPDGLRESRARPRRSRAGGTRAQDHARAAAGSPGGALTAADSRRAALASPPATTPATCLRCGRVRCRCARRPRVLLGRPAPPIGVAGHVVGSAGCRVARRSCPEPRFTPARSGQPATRGRGSDQPRHACGREDRRFAGAGRPSLGPAGNQAESRNRFAHSSRRPSHLAETARPALAGGRVLPLRPCCDAPACSARHLVADGIR